MIHIQPDEGIALGFSAKIPGPTMKLGHVRMNFNYADYFGAAPSTGYETLILDCMIGDPTLFQRDEWSRLDGASSLRYSICGRRCRHASSQLSGWVMGPEGG